MSKIKKITSMFLVVAMLFVTTITAFAADGETTQSLTVKKQNGEGLIDGVEFAGYRILDAKKSGDTFVYKVNSNYADFFNDATNDDYGNYTFDENKGILCNGVAFLPIDGINGEEGNDNDSPTGVKPSTEMAQFTENLQKFIKAKGIHADVTPIVNGVSTDVPVGYYMVKEIAPDTNTPIVASKAMVVNVTKDPVTMYPKDAEASLEKKIVEDSKKTDTNDAQLGDLINYEITSVIPTYDSSVDWKDILFKYTDNLSKGLEFQEDSFKIEIIEAAGTNPITGNDQLIKDDYTVTTTGDSANGTTLDITFTTDGLRKIGKAGGFNQTLKISYNAKLTSDAIISTDGNPNEIKLEYTNNPDIENSKNELTDTVKTFAYSLGLTKYGQDSDGANTPFNESVSATFKIYSTLDDLNNDSNALGTLVTDNTGKGTFLDVNDKPLALDSKEYWIKETEVTGGYSLLAYPIKITITSEVIDGDLTGKAIIIAEAAIYNEETKGYDLEKIAEVQVGDLGDEGDDNIARFDLALSVVNHDGISLPGTGGIGTQGFLMIGGALVVIAGGLLIVSEMKRKKKLNK